MPKTVSEMIYYRMPIFLQNAIFSLYGLKLSKARYNKFFFNYLRNLKESEWWSAKEIQEYQNMLLPDQMLFCQNLNQQYVECLEYP